MKILHIAALALLAIPLAACDKNAAEEACVPVKYEHGLYYFPCRGKEFLKAYEDFLGENSDTLRVVATAADDTGFSGVTIGYAITTENRQ